MKFTSVILLLGVTAGIVYLKKDLFLPAPESAEASETSLLFPDLKANINEVQTVEIATGDESFTLSRGEDSWGLQDKAGYPADGKKLLKLLVAMGEAEIVEQKTANAELYSRIGVEDPAEGKDSRRVTLTSASGPIASLIIGNRRENKAGGGVEAYYVRRADEPTSWLVEARLDVTAKDADWLDRDILDVAADKIQAVEIKHADESQVYALKSDATATDMELQEIPAGQELRYASVANSLASGLQRLQMDDVVAADSVTFDNPPQAVATFWSFDGLRYTITTQLAEDKLYARFAVSYDETPAPGVSPAAEPATDETSETGETSEGASDEPKADQAEQEKRSPEEMKAEAEELNARLSSWIYVLPSWKKSTFQKAMADMVKDIAPPPGAESETEGELDPLQLGPPIPVLPGADDAGLAPAGDETAPAEDGAAPAEAGAAPAEGAVAPGEEGAGVDAPSTPDAGQGGDQPPAVEPAPEEPAPAPAEGPPTETPKTGGTPDDGANGAGGLPPTEDATGGTETTGGAPSSGGLR